jgi:hypothetical protein
LIKAGHGSSFPITFITYRQHHGHQQGIKRSLPWIYQHHNNVHHPLMDRGHDTNRYKINENPEQNLKENVTGLLDPLFFQ